MAFASTLSRRPAHKTSVQRCSSLCSDCIRIRKLVDGDTGTEHTQSHGHITRQLSSLERLSRQGCIGCAVLYQAGSMQDQAKYGSDIKADYRFLSIGGVEIYNIAGELEAPFGSELQTINLETPIPGRSDAEKCIQRIRDWVQNCELKHESCHRRSFMPRRLLDLHLTLGQPYSIKLVEFGRDEKDGCSPLEHQLTTESYVALSHCWGDALQITTTTANILERQGGILMSKLSKTFRDAMEITRRLGIRYLWIDALCIVQDDDTDWATEASNMSRIYSGAYLTISAASAIDGSVGIFSDRPDHMRDISIETTSGTQIRMIAVAGNVAASRFFDHRAFGGLVWLDEEDLGESLPLVRRAWTFQERILSRRVVHFAKSEMIFECNSGFSCECETQMHQAGIRQILNDISHGPSAERVLRETWWAIVMQYSSLEMTVRGDVLPALGGIARLFQQTANKHGIDLGDYCAGIWRKWLTQSLLWKQRVSRHETQGGATFAPSWSWASATGNFAVAKIEKGLRYSITIRDFQSQPVHDDVFGRLKRADLIVEAHLVPVLYDSGLWPNAYIDAEDESKSRMYIRFDHSKKQVSGARLFCMEVAVDMKRIVHGLVLTDREREGENVYERVGTFESERNAGYAFGYRFVEGGWEKIHENAQVITLV